MASIVMHQAVPHGEQVIVGVRIRRASGTGAVEIWREPCESDEIIWTDGEDEVRIPIDPRDGWSWSYAEDIEEAAREALS